MVLESIYGLMGDPKYLTSIFSRSNIGFPNFDVLVSGGLSDQGSHKMQKSLRRTSIAKNNKIFDNDDENYKQEYPYHHSISKNSQKSKLSIKDEEMGKEKQK